MTLKSNSGLFSSPIGAIFRSSYTWNRSDFLSAIYPIESTEDEKPNGSESDFYEIS